MKKTFLYCLVFIVCTACREWKAMPIKSFVTDYYDYSGIVLKTATANEIVIFVSDMQWVCGWNSTKVNKVVYDSVCSRHNDTLYNSYTAIHYGNMQNDVPIFHDLQHSHSYFFSDIKEINITSDADFDEQHQTQTLLNDIVEFKSISPRQHINSEYKDLFDGWSNADFFYSFIPDTATTIRGVRLKQTDFPVIKLLSELSVEDLSLVGEISSNVLCWLVFTQEPTLEQTHNFTITIKLLNGKVFSNNITKTF